jgi:hypothetical protein
MAIRPTHFFPAQSYVKGRPSYSVSSKLNRTLGVEVAPELTMKDFLKTSLQYLNRDEILGGRIGDINHVIGSIEGKCRTAGSVLSPVEEQILLSMGIYERSTYMDRDTTELVHRVVPKDVTYDEWGKLIDSEKPILAHEAFDLFGSYSNADKAAMLEVVHREMTLTSEAKSTLADLKSTPIPAPIELLKAHTVFRALPNESEIAKYEKLSVSLGGLVAVLSHYESRHADHKYEHALQDVNDIYRDFETILSHKADDFGSRFGVEIHNFRAAKVEAHFSTLKELQANSLDSKSINKAASEALLALEELFHESKTLPPERRRLNDVSFERMRTALTKLTLVA